MYWYRRLQDSLLINFSKFNAEPCQKGKNENIYFEEEHSHGYSLMGITQVAPSSAASQPASQPTSDLNGRHSAVSVTSGLREVNRVR